MSSNPFWTHVARMEGDVRDISRWGDVLHAMGAADDVPPECLRVISNALSDLGGRLEAQFDEALKAAGPGGSR